MCRIAHKETCCLWELGLCHPHLLDILTLVCILRPSAYLYTSSLTATPSVCSCSGPAVTDNLQGVHPGAVHGDGQEGTAKGMFTHNQPSFFLYCV